MRLSPDEIIFWQYGFFKLNATIVFTWGLMLLMVVASRLITRRLSKDLRRSRWQNLLEIIVTGIVKQIEEVGLSQPQKYLGFLGTLFLFVAVASLGTIIPGYEPPTGSLSTTTALALCVFVAVPLFGIAFNVDPEEIGVVLLGAYWDLNAGDEVQRTGRVMDVGVGDGLLGRVIDPLGRPLDGDGPVHVSRRLPVERPAAHIMDRAPVTVPLQTGLKVIDALIPVGRGQRELILGDRQTGKTTIAIDTILNQHGKNVVCVYCAIGQRASAVAKVVAILREKDAMDYTVVVVTEGNDPPGLAYIAPYAATSIAESFMEAGRDVLIVYDDLTHHARAYRELSLLLRRPPGREAFPGDIFYIHSRLLERATHLCVELGGGSLTALPISETEAQDISACIPTNLISITDGQIYLSPSLFELGVLPAVDVGKSVSRVGGKAQLAAYSEVAGDLKLAYAHYAPVSQRLLPLDNDWSHGVAELPWPTKNLPEVMGGGTATLQTLIREYLFVCLFRACAESLASENASRLAAMQRADKNIDELLEGLNRTFHRLRQNGIDEELFDVVSGFEALSSEQRGPIPWRSGNHQMSIELNG